MGGLRPCFPSVPVSPPWALLSLPLPLPVVHQDRCFAQHPLGPSGPSATLSQNGHSQPQDPENHFSSWLCSHPLPPQSVSQVQREIRSDCVLMSNSLLLRPLPSMHLPHVPSLHSLIPSKDYYASQPHYPASPRLLVPPSQGGQRAQFAWPSHFRNESPHSRQAPSHWHCLLPQGHQAQP